MENLQVKKRRDFYPSFEIEKKLISQGYSVIAGIDEAGRGSLAGPLSVGLVIYSKDFILNFSNQKIIINDSKKLSALKRKKALEEVEELSYCTLCSFVSHKKIDRLNVNKATELGIHSLLARTKLVPEVIIMDGNFSFKLPIPFISVLQGDQKSISIASASIKAKVTRDNLMGKIDQKYPDYDFKGHKGYGTAKHRDLLKKHGVSLIHRRSYEPAKSLLAE